MRLISALKQTSLSHFPCLHHLVDLKEEDSFSQIIHNLQSILHFYSVNYNRWKYNKCTHTHKLTIMLGNVAYRGSLSLRSAVTTAGVESEIVSKPPSISRTTFNPASVFSMLEAKVAWKINKQKNLNQQGEITSLKQLLFHVYAIIRNMKQKA